jgi:hypothetical protein
MKQAILFAAALTLVALLAACEDGGGDDGTKPTVEIVAPGVTVSVQQDGTPVVQETPVATPTSEGEVCAPNPDPASPEVQVIDQPSAGDTVTSPVTISGQVLAFEATYQVGIFDADGNPIVEAFDTADAIDVGVLAPFSIDVAFAVDAPTPACIWVYEASARDGGPVNVGQIPVTLAP